jgi:hypothetical protein
VPTWPPAQGQPGLADLRCRTHYRWAGRPKRLGVSETDDSPGRILHTLLLGLLIGTTLELAVGVPFFALRN